MLPGHLRPSRFFSHFILIYGLFSTIIGCERASREPESINLSRSPDVSQKKGEETKRPSASRSEASKNNSDACIVPLVTPPPTTATNVSECPDDPRGRPTMPLGKVSFPETPNAPTLRVELALTDPHRNHGLMFRPKLSDDEGMLFSWSEEKPRAFWMRNTCLALDMLFIAQDGTVAGILEQVPPMNEVSRRNPCPAAHVLEVRAGWTRKYGVLPGQKISISASELTQP